MNVYLLKIWSIAQFVIKRLLKLFLSFCVTSVMKQACAAERIILRKKKERGEK